MQRLAFIPAWFLFAMNLLAQAPPPHVPPHWFVTQRVTGRLKPGEREGSVSFVNDGCKQFDLHIDCTNDWTITLQSPDGKRTWKADLPEEIDTPDGPGMIGTGVLAIPEDHPPVGTWTVLLKRSKYLDHPGNFSFVVTFHEPRFGLLPYRPLAIQTGQAAPIHLIPYETMDQNTGAIRPITGATIRATAHSPRVSRHPSRSVQLVFKESTPGSGDFQSTLRFKQTGQWTVRYVVTAPTPDGKSFTQTYEGSVLVTKGPSGRNAGYTWQWDAEALSVGSP